MNDTHIYAAHLLAETRIELGRADNKAATLLGAAGVVVGVVLAALLAGQWRPTHLPMAAQAVWWVAVAAGAAGVGLLAAAVAPRAVTTRRQVDVARYFGDVVAAYATGGPDELDRALAAGAADPADRTRHQLITLSRIAVTKYRLIRHAMTCLSAAGILTGLAALVAVFTAAR